jgi:hypothetical protein
MTLKLDFKNKLILVLIFLIVCFFRSPYILTEGRMMAEDGGLYFKSAFENDFLDHLIYFAPNAGYYNFIANFLTEISTYSSIYKAPLIISYGSLIFIILPIILILFNNSYLFNNNFERVTLCLLLFITTPNTPEIWLNSINLQIHLFISSFLILYFKKETFLIKCLSKLILLVSGLSGIYSCILTPFFFVKFYINKKKDYFYNFIILLICSFFQLSLILYSKLNNLLHVSKSQVISEPVNFLSIFVYSYLIKPIFGRELSYYFTDIFFAILEKKYLLILLFFFISLPIFFLIKSSFLNFLKNDKIFKSLLGVYLSVIIVIFVGADNSPPTGRYATIPGLLFLVLIYYLSINFPRKYIKYALKFLVLISILVGVYEFRPHSKYIRFLDCINCPHWKNEIYKWELNSQYVIKIWPYNQKNMMLNEKN